MIHRFSQAVIAGLISLVLALGLGIPAAHAYDNPELLPEEQTPIIDLAHSFADGQIQSLVQELEDFEVETGWKLRVLTQYDRTPGRAIKDYWDLDAHSFLVVADPRGGNLLNFNVGGDFYRIIPRTFWVELQTRFGNLYYVRDNGEDGAILGALRAVETCVRQNGCSVVPGLPQEQWVLTFVSSILGGIICGLAGYPRKPGQSFAWQWVLVLSPLWGILFLAFGVGPIVTRTSDWLPLAQNAGGFVVGALVAYLPSQFRNASPSET
ncbi:TPM domain-containing protein [Prochlorothrix hollandica]|uniref:Methanol dehydrogenase n=1 Tax=Prochlorothrix hollandica PCC 9006 = CALU 1027 TaxID=317619 RepID=A0A0M2PUU9_PROHO|nr:TPM domain-containing protein [Prochlorothrix hollandica]KKI99889.1 methanol dehydrogenase [Prochlorothrix hollandica PCC 9006 = CALU 1027]